jgi:hypothetical protein
LPSKYNGPTERLELYESAVAEVEGMETKGATMPYTSLNGHMTSFLDKQGSLAIRLSAEDREDFLQRFDTRLAVQYGKEMREFVVVPDSLLEDPVDLAGWLKRANDWVGTLKPK